MILSRIFKRAYKKFWSQDYPDALEHAGFNNKTIGIMIRQGARADARAEIRRKKQEKADENDS